MTRTCEIIYWGVDEKGRKLPRLRGFGEIPLLHTSRLPACLARKAELTLAIGVVGASGIKRLVSEKPLQVSLAIAGGTLAFGVAATAVTYYLSR